MSNSDSPKKSLDDKVYEENEIKVSHNGSVRGTVSRVEEVFKKTTHKEVTLYALGSAIPKLVQSAEILKRIFGSLHQMTEMSNIEVPRGKDGADKKVKVPRCVITLSKEMF